MNFGKGLVIAMPKNIGAFEFLKYWQKSGGGVFWEVWGISN